MEVWEKINYLIAEKQMSKKEFIDKLLALKPILKSTGEVPSYTTINGYIYGKREIKIELIPYISEVLGVSEQELFSFDIEYASGYNYRYSREIREIVELLQYAPNLLVEEIRVSLQKHKKLYEESSKKLS